VDFKVDLQDICCLYVEDVCALLLCGCLFTCSQYWHHPLMEDMIYEFLVSIILFGEIEGTIRTIAFGSRAHYVA
jgi:hypothetical protein